MLRAMASDATSYFENAQPRAAGWLAAWDGQGIPRPERQVCAGAQSSSAKQEGHLFTDNAEALTDAVSAWLAEQHM